MAMKISDWGGKSIYIIYFPKIIVLPRKINIIFKKISKKKKSKKKK